jgi:hypothetical protein
MEQAERMKNNSGAIQEDDHRYAAMAECNWLGKTELLGEKNVQLLIHPHEMPELWRAVQ